MHVRYGINLKCMFFKNSITDDNNDDGMIDIISNGRWIFPFKTFLVEGIHKEI